MVSSEEIADPMNSVIANYVHNNIVAQYCQFIRSKIVNKTVHAEICEVWTTFENKCGVKTFLDIQSAAASRRV